MLVKYSYRAAQIEARELQGIISDGRATNYSEAEAILEKNYVQFGKMGLPGVNMQTQYSSRYLEGTAGYPDLGDDIRIAGNPNLDYHSLKIHEEDIPLFAQRIVDYRRSVGAMV